MMATGTMICASIAIVALCVSTTWSFSCLKGEDQNPIFKHYFYWNEKPTPIKIETSERPSHQLSSYILQILLSEILGYDDVTLVNSYNTLNVTDTVRRIAGCQGNRCFPPPVSSLPETMVNVELWSEFNINNNPFIKQGYIQNAGPLGPEGRYGWYIPTFIVEQNWKNHRIITDHWRAFRNTNVSKIFSSSDQLGDILSMLLDIRNRNCSGCGGHDAFILGPNCKLVNSSCALLLSSYPGYDMGRLQRQVQNLRLNVSLAWMGSNLDGLIQQRTHNQQPSLFFSWTPNTLVDNYNFTRVHLPNCKQSNKLSSNCDYQTNKFYKIVWSPLSKFAPEAYHVIKSMKFTQKQYEDLLKLHENRIKNRPAYNKRRSSYKHSACEWIKKNYNVWKNWIPDLTTKKKIYIGAMFPLTGPFWRQPGIVPGAQLALEHINRDHRYLSQYEIVLLVRDTQCKTDIAMKEFMHLIANETYHIAGILGPGCSNVAENIAGVSKHFHKPVVSYSAEALHMKNRESFPWFFRIVPPITRNGVVFVNILSTFQWKQVVLLAEDGEFPEYHSILDEYFSANGINVILQKNIPRPTNMKDADKYLSEILSNGGKIIVLTSFEVSARAIMCQAYRRGMTAKEGYVWFLPHWFTREWWNTDILNKQFEEITSCNTAEMLEAINGHFSLSSAVYGDPDTVTIGNITVRQWQDMYIERLKKLDAEKHYSPYASYAYDSVWVFALALHQLIKENPSALMSLDTDHTSSHLMHFMNKTEFTGVSGPVQFSSSDRTGIINIHQFQENISCLIGRYVPNNPGYPLELDMDEIKWYTKAFKVPTDGSSDSSCGIERLRVLLGVTCDIAIVVVNLVILAILAVFVVLLILTVKMRYDNKVKATRKRMEELGLMQDSNILSLDEWEIDREKVVLNRKLGEGAFGTVYGGEALVETGWVAVAVKTLKVGSNAIEKLDFLSEAEMMKRFRHDNIVKLLGVCTRGEPAYTIMEFMLYGDLKTFLLDRRHVVCKNNTEEQDVSPHMLTKYSLDIAQGLHYLATLKYVHRDIACRNCLVHASKTVKISDFGMTRHTYDSDYYRFNRKGMLPVRWMAPESLTDGLFRHSSDIWSYGILLYEIMTFGSFPYQGLSNTQVLDYVRDGRTIVLPTAASQQLKELVTSCWQLNQGERPTAANIVTKLTDSPTLVQPCLDVPQSSLTMEYSNTYEDFQAFRLKLKKSSAISSQLKLFNSLDKLPTIKRSVSRLTLVGDDPSVFYWVRDFDSKPNRDNRRDFSESLERKLEEPTSDSATTTLLYYSDGSLPKKEDAVDKKSSEYDRLTQVL